MPSISGNTCSTYTSKTISSYHKIQSHTSQYTKELEVQDSKSQIQIPATLDESSTMRPPPSAPPDTWSRALTKTYEHNKNN